MSAIPAELRARDQWVVWRYEERDGKRTKVPYQPASPKARASTIDPSTWGDFQTASAAAGDGIGFVFAEVDDFAGVDLDNCIDGDKIDPTAAAIVLALDSYTERSPSGRGLHVIIRGQLNGGRRKTGNFECYDAGRYFAVTGNHVAGTPLTINERGAELDEVRAEMFPPTARPRAFAGEHSCTSNPGAIADDHELLELARVAKNGSKFSALYYGSGHEGYPSDSEADQALASMLAFWFVEPARIDQAFRGSARMREKWDERHGESTYGELTIAKALEGRSEFYSAKERPTGGGKVINLHALREKPGKALEAADGEFLDLATILDRSEAYNRRYVALSEAQHVAVPLWIAHTHVLAATATTCYLHTTSPEPECGKTRLLEVIEPQVPSPMFAANLTTAVLFRAVEEFKPTLFIDESDNLLDPQSKGELLGLINAGYRRGAHAFRMGGGNRDQLKRFDPFSAKVIAGLDDLAPTLASRCLRIEMQRRSADEPVEDFFREDAHAEAEPIREALEAWAEQATEELRRARHNRLGVRDRLEESLRLPLRLRQWPGSDGRREHAMRSRSWQAWAPTEPCPRERNCSPTCAKSSRTTATPTTSRPPTSSRA
jgi:putative DNA primase/helicase